MFNNFYGKYVIIRTCNAGVHFGILSEYEPLSRHALLIDSRRIWYWEGAFTLSAIACDGVKSAKISKSLHKIIVGEVIEIIPCSEAAEKNLLSLEEYKP